MRPTSWCLGEIVKRADPWFAIVRMKWTSGEERSARLFVWVGALSLANVRHESKFAEFAFTGGEVCR